MPVTPARRTPGVYVTELSSFPPSIVGVQTAVPAFIGYTEKAEINGKPVFLQPIRIGSLADYEAVFGKAFKPLYTIQPASQTSPPRPDYYDFKVYRKPGSPPVSPPALGWQYYKLAQTTATRFNLYNSMRLFYDNGGANCFIVSVGDYNKTISESDLQEGLKAVEEQVGPTMLVIPDAVLLGLTDHGKVARKTLEQCGRLQDRVAILDVHGAATATKGNLDALILDFRKEVGSRYLNYGMAYFPFVQTTVVPLSSITYTNIAPDSFSMLADILRWETDNLYGDQPARAESIKRNYIAKISATDKEPEKLNQDLTAALPLLLDIERLILERNDVLPPSGAMAGVFTFTDATRGVWNAPANISLASVVKPTLKLDNKQQEDLNVPLDGKAVDVLREFTGRGTVVWGARTLDGNSNDYRYIQVRRTLIYIEQSVKIALNQFVFAANDGNTWTTVVSMISNFLQGLWSQGGLLGATAAEAFSVQCGLGSTMTAQNILEGYMIVQITLQMVRPAEFIELTFKQKMEGGAG